MTISSVVFKCEIAFSVDVDVATRSDFNTNQELFVMQDGVTKVRVYMWLEGQDVDSENNASFGNIDYYIQPFDFNGFYIKPATEKQYNIQSFPDIALNSVTEASDGWLYLELEEENYFNIIKNKTHKMVKYYLMSN